MGDEGLENMMSSSYGAFRVWGPRPSSFFPQRVELSSAASLCNAPLLPLKPPPAFAIISNGVGLEIYAARKNQSGSRLQQTKRWKTDESAKKIGHAGIEKYRNLFDDKDSSSEANLVLREDQAVGQVVAAQANFMRVFIERTWDDGNKGKESSNSKQKHSVNGVSHIEETVGFDEDELERTERASRSTIGPTISGNAWEVHSGVKAGTELLCVVRALLKKIKRRVLVGDRVLVSGIDWTERRGMVEDVLDRRSEIAEPPVANVEHLLVLFALDRPKLEPTSLSRFLVEAESTGIPFTLVLNKADLVPEQVRKILMLVRRCRLLSVVTAWLLSNSHYDLAYLYGPQNNMGVVR